MCGWSFFSTTIVKTLDLDEAAALLKMHKQTVLQKVRNGEIPGAKLGKCWVFIEEDLIKWIRSLYHSPQQDVRQGGNIQCSLKEKTVNIGGINLPHQTASQYAAVLKLPTKEKLRN